jgi:hypothetical protein
MNTRYRYSGRLIETIGTSLMLSKACRAEELTASCKMHELVLPTIYKSALFIVRSPLWTPLGDFHPQTPGFAPPKTFPSCATHRFRAVSFRQGFKKAVLPMFVNSGGSRGGRPVQQQKKHYIKFQMISVTLTNHNSYVPSTCRRQCRIFRSQLSDCARRMDVSGTALR